MLKPACRRQDIKGLAVAHTPQRDITLYGNRGIGEPPASANPSPYPLEEFPRHWKTRGTRGRRGGSPGAERGSVSPQTTRKQGEVTTNIEDPAKRAPVGSERVDRKRQAFPKRRKFVSGFIIPPTSIVVWVDSSKMKVFQFSPLSCITPVFYWRS